MSDEPKPAGRESVCPRCGTAAAESVWCEGCGLNLKQQGALPTADAFAARIREQRWLAAQAEEADAARAEHDRALEERRATEAKAKEEERDRREREEERTRTKESARQEPDQPPRTGRKKWPVVLASVLVLLAGGGATAVVLLQARGDGQSGSQAAGRGGPPEKSPAIQGAPPSPPSCSRSATQRELERRSLLGDGFSGVSRVICRDFTGDGAADAAFTRASIGSAGTLGWGVLTAKADGGWDLPVLREDDASVGIKVDGSDLLRSEPIATKNDPNCCPSGGAEIEVYRFENGRFRKATKYEQPGEAFPAGFYEKPAEQAAATPVEECGDAGTVSGGYVRIENVTAREVGCASARRFIPGFANAGTHSGNFSCDESRACTYRGWQCVNVARGGSTDHRCSRGSETIRWQSR